MSISHIPPDLMHAVTHCAGNISANTILIIHCINRLDQLLMHCSFHSPGLQHVGCYTVPRFSRSLALLEGLTEDLSDQPRNRIDPVRKCGQGAQQFRFTLFSVSANYCISGSNRLSDYQTEDSTFCQDGVGAYRFGVFFMDVYQIVSNQDFQVSADEIANSHSPVLTPSVVTLLLSMLAVLGTTLAIL